MSVIGDIQNKIHEILIGKEEIAEDRKLIEQARASISDVCNKIHPNSLLSSNSSEFEGAAATALSASLALLCGKLQDCANSCDSVSKLIGDTLRKFEDTERNLTTQMNNLK